VGEAPIAGPLPLERVDRDHEPHRGDEEGEGGSRDSSAGHFVTGSGRRMKDRVTPPERRRECLGNGVARDLGIACVGLVPPNHRW